MDQGLKRDCSKSKGFSSFLEKVCLHLHLPLLEPEWKEDSDPFNNDFLKSEMEGKELRLSCPAKGRPKPDITWYKDTEPFFPTGPEVCIVTAFKIPSI